MELKYFPSIKKIQIKNFSLYPGDLNFSYDFIQGINLIIGGNGVGKTTFLNILKFALIGLYKKGLDTKRREYKGIEYRYDKRINLPYKFFSNRMDDVEYKLLAEVTLTFSLNRTLFEVTRDLYSPSVKKVFVTDLESGEEIKLDGIIVNQYDFDMLFSDKLKNQRDLEDTLQWKYEEAVAKASNYEFFEIGRAHV